ncbi:TraB/GumN family protein [Filobacillus milosensis]|uniref:TraB/GumN family protein n=1 Tax=Filobacillus milosensis TaxID=94137 RepID=A0A4Y8IEG6_9BACI|nr:TraB/GumN family protein [Filobacillus milosensis]TFB14626.1 TraB/GumN family protein [Filobacillus milosensis]
MKNYLKVIAILFLSLWLIACNADEQPKETDESQETNTEEQEEVENESTEEENSEDKTVGREDGPGGFLWKVENEGVTVYLQGTIHVGPKSLYPLHTEIEQAYQKADVVVPEVDMNNIDLGKANQLYKELGTYQDGTKLKDHVSDELYQEVSTTIEGFGMQMKKFETYKPWFISNLIQQLKAQELGYTFGVDQYFLNKADMDGKEVVALETMEQQLNLLATAASEDYQIEMLKEMLAVSGQYKEEINEMLDIYREGDKEALLDMLVEDSEEEHPNAEAYLKALNDDRNYNMADQIMKFLESGDEKTYFVIVGSLHLIQEPHIGSILKENGYDVERVH